ALRTGGDLESAYYGRKTVFKPGLAARATAGALDAAAGVTKSLNEQLDRLAEVPPVAATYAEGHGPGVGCALRLAHYAHSVQSVVTVGGNDGKGVLVVTQAYVAGLHREQQREMGSMMERKFAGNRNVRYVNLGDAISLPDPALAYDGMHLNAQGNAVIAER